MKNIAESTWYGIGSFLPGILFQVTVFMACVLLHKDAMMPLYGIPLAAAALLAVVLFWFYVITMSMDAERLSDSRTQGMSGCSCFGWQISLSFRSTGSPASKTGTVNQNKRGVFNVLE